MINVKELRVGNWVLYPHTQPELYQIVEPRQIGNANTLIPIPLTPDWLDRCGLIKNKYGNIELAPQFLLKENILKDEFGITEGYIIQPMGWHGAVSKPIIKHLHQLQNLYLDLTGEELNVKL